ncbi:MAG TPA: ParA family protein [Phenylobacterium sp.]
MAIYSPKGGVGKSTFAVNLAYLSANTSRRRTLLWDIDAQGAASYLLDAQRAREDARKIFSKDVDPAALASPSVYANFTVLAADPSLRRLDVQLVEEDARKRLRKIVRTLEKKFERIIVDCPPGLNEVSEQVFRAVDLVIMPTPPSRLGMRAMEQAVAHSRAHHRDGPEILPVFSLVDLRRKLHRDVIAAHPDWPVVPYASVIEQMGDRCAPLGVFAPRHTAARAFAEVWAHVEQRLVAIESTQSDLPGPDL